LLTGNSKVQEVRKAWDDIDRMIVKAIGKDAAESLAGFAGNLREQLGGRIPGLNESES
jgi:hypothetical protein